MIPGRPLLRRRCKPSAQVQLRARRSIRRSPLPRASQACLTRTLTADAGGAKGVPGADQNQRTELSDRCGSSACRLYERLVPKGVFRVLPIGAHPGRLHPDQALRACYLSTVPSSIAETLAVPLLDAIEEFPTSKELVALGSPGSWSTLCETAKVDSGASTRVAFEWRWSSSKLPDKADSSCEWSAN